MFLLTMLASIHIPDQDLVYAARYYYQGARRSYSQIYLCRHDGTKRIQVTNEERDSIAPMWVDQTHIAYFHQGVVADKDAFPSGKLSTFRAVVYDVSNGTRKVLRGYRASSEGWLLSTRDSILTAQLGVGQLASNLGSKSHQPSSLLRLQKNTMTIFHPRFTLRVKIAFFTIRIKIGRSHGCILSPMWSLTTSFSFWETRWIGSWLASRALEFSSQSPKILRANHFISLRTDTKPVSWSRPGFVRLMWILIPCFGRQHGLMVRSAS